MDLCDVYASLLPRLGIEPGPAAWQDRNLALHHVSGLGLILWAILSRLSSIAAPVIVSDRFFMQQGQWWYLPWRQWWPTVN